MQLCVWRIEIEKSVHIVRVEELVTSLHEFLQIRHVRLLCPSAAPARADTNGSSGASHNIESSARFCRYVGVLTSQHTCLTALDGVLVQDRETEVRRGPWPGQRIDAFGQIATPSR